MKDPEVLHKERLLKEAKLNPKPTPKPKPKEKKK